MRVHEELAMLAHKISDLEQQLKEEKKVMKSFIIVCSELRFFRCKLG